MPPRRPGLTAAILPAAIRAAAILLSLGATWGAGFAAFDHITRRSAQIPPHADAIVVLTGGADRIETGFRLFEEGRAPLMLISGVGRGADLGELGRGTHLSPDQASRVTLGRAATSTLGNAEETAIWVQAHAVHSLIVVTAGYHMPRALIEIGRAAPDVTLYPAPVRPTALRRRMETGTVRMLSSEFDKYLAVWLGLTRKAGPGS